LEELKTEIRIWFCTLRNVMVPHQALLMVSNLYPGYTPCQHPREQAACKGTAAQ